VLRTAAGEVALRRDGELVYVSARPEWGPPHEFAELASPDEVDALEGPPGGHDLLTVWSWLCAQLGRPIDIRQGRSSRILARPGEDGFVEIGGRSLLDEVRDYTLP
jgi:hypothetical protein